VIRFVAFLLTTGAKAFAGRLVRLISRGTPDDAGTVSSPWFAALPGEEQKMAALFWVQPKFPLTIASQLENLPVSAASVAAHPVFCEGPVVILSARTSSDRRRAEHAAMAARLPMGEHINVDGSNHWIMQQQPEIVLDAIDRVVAHATKATALTGGSRS
jgi:pimeloyl-ACP methyl ester carboxylesterase